MENLVYVLLRGFAIGVLLSAPMGPIGMLVIQRTLNKGRWAAFFTGIGASLSDLLYCLLTGFGMSFITEFVEQNQMVLQLIGSVVLAAFGIYLFRNNPARALRHPGPGANTYWKDLMTGFLFTVSNPLILFFIIGLFARFNFLLPEFEFIHYVSGYASIVIGAIFWWFSITYSVNKVRSHFNVRSLWLVNRIIGGLLIIFSIAGAVTGINDLLG
ncbi:MAG: LysE family translocator [Muribaculaceae bacterium]|nr:LysE family translocator [Muribaculaceae bacterium]